MSRAMHGLVVMLAMAGVAGASESTIWDRYPGEDFVRLADRYELTMNAEGHLTTRHVFVYQALTDSGRESLQSLEYDVNHAVEAFVLERACSVSLDGTERCVDDDDVVREPEEGAEIVEGVHEPFHVVVPLLDVRVGSRVEVTYRRELKASADHRVFGRYRPMYGSAPTEGLTVVLDSPIDRPFFAHAPEGAEVDRTEEGGRLVQTFTFGPQPRKPRDRDRPKLDEQSPPLYVSEFEDWESFSAWFQPIADAAAERFSGGGLRELQGLSEPRMSALDPVIRLGTLLDDRCPEYTVELTSATVVPGPMETVVKRGGTEVERAVALWTALKAEGVDAHLALATRNRIGLPVEFPSLSMFQDMGVWVDDRGFVHPSEHPDWVDTIPSARRRGGVVVLDPEGPRVVQGEQLDPPEHRPGQHRLGRLTVSGGELRVHERLWFSGSAETAARGFWRAFQDDLEDDEKADRRSKQWYARYLRKYPEEKLTNVEIATYKFLRERDYAQGRVRAAEMFDPWDPDAETEMVLRYVPDDALEEVGSLLLVRLPLRVEEVSARKVRARPDREAPVRISCWEFTYWYELEIPDGYTLAGLPQEQQIDNEFGRLTLRYEEAQLVPADAGDGGGDRALPDSREAEDGARTVPGVTLSAVYEIHQNRVPVEGYDAFLQLAARHALSFTDPVVLRRGSGD